MDRPNVVVSGTYVKIMLLLVTKSVRATATCTYGRVGKLKPRVGKRFFSASGVEFYQTKLCLLNADPGLKPCRRPCNFCHSSYTACRTSVFWRTVRWFTERIYRHL